MKKKRIIKPDPDQLIDRSILREELTIVRGEFKQEILASEKRTEAKLTQLSHSTDSKIDFVYKEVLAQGQRLGNIEVKLTQVVDNIQQMCDKVLRDHEVFRVESESMRGNYTQLEERVYILEEKVLPKV